MDGAAFDSPAEKAGFDFDQVIKETLVSADQPPRQLFFIPALLLLGFIYWLQKGRLARTASSVGQREDGVPHV